MDIDRLIAHRSRALDWSGIRRFSALARSRPGVINLSIGQPDFAVDPRVKAAAVEAILADRNGYTPNQGVPELQEALAAVIRADLGWDCGVIGPASTPTPSSVIVTTGTSGALTNAYMALLNPGDEIIIPDPYFVLYPQAATLCDARAVLCDTYPDFVMTAQRVEPLITPRTKAVLLNTPGNPTGAVASSEHCAQLLDLCRRRNVLLISDEIYDEFTFAQARTERPAGDLAALGAFGLTRCPSPARLPDAQRDVLVVRGFGKTYGMTGWRLGYVAGPTRLIEELTKIQQYTYVCAPTPLQWAMLGAFGTDVSATVARYQARRDRALERLRRVTDVVTPGGAFYVFPRVPERLGMSGREFCEAAAARGVVIIPGGVFSTRDTHVRISLAAPDGDLDRGIDTVVSLMGA